MENRYKITYDLKQKTITNIKFKQGDINSSVLEISLIDNSVPINITGEVIEFRFYKADKTTVYQDVSTGVNIIDAINGKVECILMSNTLAVPGKLTCEIHRATSGKQLTTLSFYLNVEKSIGADGTLSVNYISSLENKVINIQSAEDIRLASETSRISNENTRKANETSRVNAETSRVGAEISRATVEANRVISETSRANAESSRVTTEGTRVTAETGRVNAETSRISAETSRAAAEILRVNSTDAIKLAYDTASKANATLEVIAARKGEVDLPTKIGKIDMSIALNASQLAESLTQQGDITQLNTTDKSSVVNAIKEVKTQVNAKAEQTSLNTTNANVTANTNDIATTNGKIASLASGSPKGVYATLALLTSAHPTGNANTYVVSADGKWYYWTAGVWIPGGIYQSIANINLLNHYFNLWYATGLYIENSPEVYVKFANLTEKIGLLTTWANLKSNINDPTKFVTSPLGVADCLVIPEDNLLVMDMTTRNMSIINRTVYNDSIHLVMIFREWSAASCGLLVDLFLSSKITNIATNTTNIATNTTNIATNKLAIKKQSTLWYGTGLYIEPNPSSLKLYIKYGNLCEVASSTNSYWSKLKTDFNDPTKFVTSPLGVADCLEIPDDTVLILDMVTNVYSFVGRFSYDGTKQLNLIFSELGYPRNGILFDIWLQNNFTNINKIPTNTDEINDMKIKVNLEAIPEYLKSHAEEKIKTVQNLITENSLVIPFVTDMHHNNSIANSYSVINEICKTTPVDIIIDGGDGQSDVNGDKKQYRLDGFVNMVKQIKRKDIFLPCCGNHDFQFYDPEGKYHDITTGNNYYIGVTQLEQYTRLMKHLDNTCVFDDANRKCMYYYKDIDSQKIRVIILNTNEGGYAKVSNTQLQWLSNKALNFTGKTTPEQWQVVVFTHCNLTDALQVGESNVQNRDIILAILKAFKNGISYTNATVGINVTFAMAGTIIGVFCGHMHLDRMAVVDGIQHIGTLNDQCAKYLDAPNRALGTTTEIAFDVITIDAINRKVNMTRFGAGIDREFIY